MHGDCLSSDIFWRLNIFKKVNKKSGLVARGTSICCLNFGDRDCNLNFLGTPDTLCKDFPLLRNRIHNQVGNNIAGDYHTLPQSRTFRKTRLEVCSIASRNIEYWLVYESLDRSFSFLHSPVGDILLHTVSNFIGDHPCLPS